MKNFTVSFAAFACCLSLMVFTACDDEKVTYKTTYMYEVVCDLGVSYYEDQEKSEIAGAFNSAIGADGSTYNTYESNQDNKMKTACDAVKGRYNNIQSPYLKFDLLRITMNSEPGSVRKNDTIASYVMGRALTHTYVMYSISTNENEAYAAMEAKNGTVDEKVYDAGNRTLKILLGRHRRTEHGYSVSFSAFDRYFMGLTNKPFEDNATFDNAVRFACDSIVSVHASDTLLVPAIISFSKTGFLDKQVTEIWRDTIPANIQ